MKPRLDGELAFSPQPTDLGTEGAGSLLVGRRSPGRHSCPLRGRSDISSVCRGFRDMLL
jgi:hypothetical protein